MTITVLVSCRQPGTKLDRPEEKFHLRDDLYPVGKSVGNSPISHQCGKVYLTVDSAIGGKLV